MKRYYEVWIEGPQGKIKLAEYDNIRQVYYVMEEFDKFSVLHALWPNIKRIIIEIIEKDSSEAGKIEQ